MKIHEYLPPFYEKFFPKSFFEKDLEPEKSADCPNCVMCKPKGQKEDNGKKYFHPDVKCCTYYPILPNYLVGAILADTSEHMAEGRKRIKEKIRERVGVSPLGMLKPEKYTLLYRNSTGFGKATSMACPYLSEGACTVWKYRNSICNTWFCSSDNGVDGQSFWDGLQQFLYMTETKLIKYTLFTLDMPSINIDLQLQKNEYWKGGEKITEDNLDDKPLSEKEYKSLWGKYYGKEEQFYIDCYRIANSLNEKQFNGILGIDGKINLKHLKDKYTLMRSDKIPEYLRRNRDIKFISIHEDGERAQLVLYNETFNVPYLLYENLIWFDGRQSNKEVFKDLKEYGVKLNKDLMLYLYKNRILVEANL